MWYYLEMSQTIEEVKKKAAPIFDQYGIKYAAVFGSAARNQDKPDSDVDLMVHFGTPMGMFAYMRFVHELENILHRKVDIVTEQSINKFVKPYIIADLTIVYEKR